MEPIVTWSKEAQEKFKNNPAPKRENKADTLTWGEIKNSQVGRWVGDFFTGNNRVYDERTGTFQYRPPAPPDPKFVQPGINPRTGKPFSETPGKSGKPPKGTDTTSGNRDTPLYPETYTVSGVTYDTASGRAINPDTGKTSDNGYSIDPSSGGRSDGPPSIPRDRMADASEDDRMAAWAKANPTLAAKVKPGQAGYDSIQKYLNPVTDSTIQDFADDSGYKKPEAEAILKGGSVESVIDSSGISTTITSPHTTSNPASSQDGASAVPDIGDQSRAIDIADVKAQKLLQSTLKNITTTPPAVLTDEYFEQLDSGQLTGPGPYIK